MHFSTLALGYWANQRWILKNLRFLMVTQEKMRASNTSDCQPHAAVQLALFLLPSEGRISDSPVHLQRCHLHIWDLGSLGASCRAVPCRSSHGTEARGGATHVSETWRSHSGTPQEPAWRHQVPVALRVREGVAWTAGAGAADASSSCWRGRCCFGLSHLEHHLKVWANCDKVNMSDKNGLMQTIAASYFYLVDNRATCKCFTSVYFHNLVLFIS